MRNVALLLICVAFSSVCLSKLNDLGHPNKEVASVKAQVILGHRIGPNGQEMLVVK